MAKMTADELKQLRAVKALREQLKSSGTLEEVAEFKKLIKQFNRRIAVLGQKYGKDSAYYLGIIEEVKSYLPGNWARFFKIASGGYFAIDQKLGSLVKMFTQEGVLSIQNALEVTPTHLQSRKDAKDLIDMEDLFSDFDSDVKELKEYQEFKERIILDAKSAARTWMDNHRYGISSVVMKSGLEVRTRRPTYWEWYKAIAEYIGEDWHNFTKTTKAMVKPTQSDAKPMHTKKAIAMANKAKKEAQKKGTNPYANSKPAKPNF